MFPQLNAKSLLFHCTQLAFYCWLTASNLCVSTTGTAHTKEFKGQQGLLSKLGEKIIRFGLQAFCVKAGLVFVK